jgi:hypothetical protein
VYFLSLDFMFLFVKMISNVFYAGNACGREAKVGGKHKFSRDGFVRPPRVASHQKSVWFVGEDETGAVPRIIACAGSVIIRRYLKEYDVAATLC